MPLSWMAAIVTAALPLFSFQDGFVQPVQEVFESETPYPQGRGEVQIRMLSMFDRYRTARGPDLPVSFEYGLTDRLQVSFGWRGLGSQAGPLAPGLRSACTEFGVKRAFMNVGGSPVHTAMGVEAASYQGRLEYAPFTAVAIDLPWKKPTHWFGSAARGFRTGSDTPWYWATGLLVPLRDNLRVTGEVSSGMRGSADTSIHLTPGVVWRIDGIGELGAGLAVGTGAAAGRAGLIVSFVHEFNWPRR